MQRVSRALLATWTASDRRESSPPEADDLYLVGTSEVALAASPSTETLDLEAGAERCPEARRQPPVQPGRGDHALAHVAAVALEGDRRLPRVVEPVPREHPDGLEQPVPPRAGQAHDEALVDELAEHRDGVADRQRGGRRLGGAEVERRREHAEVSQQTLLGAVEEPVAPLDGGLHGGVAVRLACPAPGRHGEADGGGGVVGGAGGLGGGEVRGGQQVMIRVQVVEIRGATALVSE